MYKNVCSGVYRKLSIPASFYFHIGNKNLTEDDLIDDDYDLDEEDEEDGDFIDDTEDCGNVSGYIRSMFGYDPRR